MERKKITFDSFIRGSIGCVLVVGILMLVEPAKFIVMLKIFCLSSVFIEYNKFFIICK